MNRSRGTLRLDLEKPEDFAMAMLLEIHPKHKGGQFADKNKHQVFQRIDETKLAKEQRTERSARVKALVAAQKLSDAQVVQFADAMTWDSTEELEILRARIEDMAENEPVFFNEMLAEGNRVVDVTATLKRAIDRNIIHFDSINYRYQYT